MPEEAFDCAVIGAGMVGTCCAVELARRGKSVVLLDRKEPGRETSYGNLGIIAVGSPIPLNNPKIWPTLPKLFRNNSSYFRYDLKYVLTRPGWFVSFFLGAFTRSSDRRAKAMHALLKQGRIRHCALIDEAGEKQRLRTEGWLHLCRTEKSMQKIDYMIEHLVRDGVEFEQLDGKRIAEIEPALTGKFIGGVWIKDADNVDDPGAIVEAYAGVFGKLGGQFNQSAVEHLEEQLDGWSIHTADGKVFEAKEVVIALGPWTKKFLEPHGVHIPMVYERGSHREFVPPPEGEGLNHPVYDVDGGYAISPMAGRYRITSGVYLADLDEPMEPTQLDAVEPAAREVMPIGPKTNGPDWFGSRPTFPDSLPAIGRTSKQGLWIATGHQHLGFSTGPSTGELIAQLILGETPDIDPKPYSPSRFGI